MCIKFNGFAAPTAIPYGLTLSTPTPESMTITWNTYREEDWSGDQGGFKIEITEQESGQVLNYTVLGSSSTSKALHSLHPHYHYQCRLAAYNSAGIGPYATNVTQMPQKGQFLIVFYRYKCIYTHTMLIVRAQQPSSRFSR